MISIRPADAIRLGRHTAPDAEGQIFEGAIWFVLYEHFARQLDEWQPDGRVCELLNDTSSVNNSDFWPLPQHGAARRHLAALFVEAGQAGPAADFLRHCGIVRWADLDRPIKIPGWRPRLFADPSWFNVRGRQLRKPGPNGYHPDARWVKCGELVFWRNVSWHARSRWMYRLQYAYPHHYSRWFCNIDQEPREGREHFAARVKEWIETTLEPENDHQARWRHNRERVWSRSDQALQKVFFDDTNSDQGIEKLADRLALLDKRVMLTKSRLATLIRWVESREK